MAFEPRPVICDDTGVALEAVIRDMSTQWPRWRRNGPKAGDTLGS